MNQDLIKFIELCLSDNVISDIEKEVILRKSRELGIQDDECEIIIQGLTAQKLSQVMNNQASVESYSNDAKKEIDRSTIEEIINLDSDLLEQLLEYITRIDKVLTEVTSAKFVNEKFQNWYRDLPKNLVTVNSSSILSKSRIYFDSTKECDWLDFEILDKSVEEMIASQFNLSYGSIIGKGRNHKGGFTLFLRDGFVDLNITEKSSMFGGKKQYWSVSNFMKIENINILEFDNVILQDKLYFLLRGFDTRVDSFQPLFDQISSLRVHYSAVECLRFLSNDKQFGDEIVVKLSNHIKSLIDGLITYSQSIEPSETIPFEDLNNGKRGFNPNCGQTLDFILLSVKNISNLINIRNQLTISVLRNDRKNIMLIIENLDRMGALMNYYEKSHLEKMDETIILLQDGFDNMCNLVEELSSKVGLMGRSIESEIKNINDNLTFHSVLGTIQIYQLYNISENTKKS